MCEAATVTHVTRRCARIRHQCDECFRLVTPGEFYDDVRSLVDGSWSTMAHCRWCAIAWTLLFPLVDRKCVEYSRLWETAVEAGAFRRLDAPATIDDAADLGGALGRLYGAAHDAEDRHFALYRERGPSRCAPQGRPGLRARAHGGRVRRPP